jgi:excisionase family DNA binding protein
MAEEKFLTVTEIAERLRLDVTRVRLLIRQERLPATKYGKTWLVKESDVREFERKPRNPGRPWLVKESDVREFESWADRPRKKNNRA